MALSHFGLVFIPCRVGAAPIGNRATRLRRLLAAVADSFLANAGNAGSGRRRRGRRRRASTATYGVAVRNTPIATAPGWSLRRAFSLTFRPGLYPLSGRRRAAPGAFDRYREQAICLDPDRHMRSTLRGGDLPLAVLQIWRSCC